MDNTWKMLAISLTINIIVVINAIFTKWIKTYTKDELLGGRFLKQSQPSQWRSRLQLLHTKQKWLLPSLLTEHLTTLILIGLGIEVLVSTTVLQEPYRTFPCEPHTRCEAIIVLIAANIGKYLFKIASTIIVLHKCTTPKWWIQIIHYLVSLTIYSVILFFSQNVLMGVIITFMEFSNIFYSGVYVLRKMGIQKFERVYGIASGLSVCTVLFSRLVLPVVFITLSFKYQNPMQMDSVPVAFFFFGVLFYSFINLWIFCTSVKYFEQHINVFKRRSYKQQHLDLIDILGAQENAGSLEKSPSPYFINNKLQFKWESQSENKAELTSTKSVNRDADVTRDKSNTKVPISEILAYHSVANTPKVITTKPPTPCRQATLLYSIPEIDENV